MKKIIIIVCILTTACSSHVYVSGTTYRDQKPVSKYWKDGIGIDLYYDNTIGMQTGANSIFVSDTDVYVAGYVDDKTAVYWKNGKEIKLFEGSVKYSSMATDIKITANKDIYIVGTYGENNGTLNTKIVYWKNGQIYDVTDINSKSNPVPKSIAVNGNDIYIVGHSKGNSVTYDAKYWKNGVEHMLTKGYSSSIAHSVCIYNNDVYIAGTEESGVKFIAKYWKNEKEYILPNGTEANSIIVVKDDVYVAGFERTSDGNKHIAKYWKNGYEIILQSDNDNAVANSIYVKGKDIYVAGYDGSQAVYWKNGKKIILKDGIIATSIFVK